MTDTYLSGKEACQKLGVHSRTLYNWEEKGKIDTIRTPGGKRLYNVDKYIKEQTTNKIYNDDNEEELDKLKIIYVRVSSATQKNDLESPIREMENEIAELNAQLKSKNGGTKSNKKEYIHTITKPHTKKGNKLTKRHKKVNTNLFNTFI